MQLPFYKAIHPFNGVYDRPTDELTFIYPFKSLIYTIPSNRLKARVLWHQFHTYVHSTAVLVQPGKIWFVGGHRGYRESYDSYNLAFNRATKIYDIQYSCRAGWKD